MKRHRLALLLLLPLAVVALAAPGVDPASFKSDAEIDQWARKHSPTYAAITADIKARKDIRGYRFVSKDDIPVGMAAWVDHQLEIQLNPKLKGAGRATILIFEMVNASRQVDHHQIDIAVDKGLLKTQEEFGLGHEILEYEAMRTHRLILLELEASTGALPKEFFYFMAPPPASAKEYQIPMLYEHLKAQVDSGHTAHYHKYFHIRKRALEGQRE